jgi:8-oxo-dGTP pyrophosphatase MutT (NUDIX family)
MKILSNSPGFDPQLVPVEGVDSHLPPIAPAALAPSALRLRFAAPTPWQPELIAEAAWSDREPRNASVLIPIVMRRRPTVMLTERTLHLATHSGQIAFPGGKAEDYDTDATATALREAKEEVGLEPAFIQVLGQLPHYRTGSGFIITPVVALVEPGFTLNPDFNEVADVFEVPLAFLMNPAHHQRHAYEWDGRRREWFAIPYQDKDALRFIWGATAGILRNFYRMLSA